MGERERFEVWAKTRGYKMDKFTDNNGEQWYADKKTASALDGWQASRRAALEECWEAAHTERLVDPTDSADDIAYQLAVEHCEHAIRALSKDDK